MSERVLILFAHGARDARWGETLRRLREAILAREPHWQIELAFLEFQRPSLGDALQAAASRGCVRIEIAPVFWASGGHVTNDVPPLLETFRKAHPEIALSMLPVLSELPGMTDFIARTIQSLAERPG